MRIWTSGGKRVGWCSIAVLALIGGLLTGGCGVFRQTKPAGDDVSGLLDRGRAASAEERHLDAIDSFERVLAVDYSSLDAHRGLVKAYFSLGRSRDKVEAYQARLDADPENPFHAYGLAIALYATSTGYADEALELLSKAEQRRPDLSDIPYRQGVILLDSERFEEAREAFERAMDIEDLARYRAPLALSLYQLGKPDKSLELLHGILNLRPSAREVTMAREVAERISDPFRNFPEAGRERLSRAIGWLQQADVPQNAIDILRELLLEFPEAAMVHAVLGLAYQRIDAGGEALTHLRRAVELAPHLALPQLYLANFLHSRERHEDARRAYYDALEQNPLLVEAHASLGRAALERGNADEAVRHLRAWSLLEPTKVQPMILEARALTLAGDLGASVDVLESVLALDSGHLEAHLSLAAIHVQRHSETTIPREREEHARAAQRHLDVVLESQPDNPAARRLAERIR